MANIIGIHVIIPVYNAKKYLRKAVQSVLNQPYKGVDIILVNDGSTDGSAELCDKIAAQEERVAVIHRENGGVSAARNTGIEFVLGGAADWEYIVFLDADDCWKDGFLNSQVQDLLRKGYDLVGFQSSICDKALIPISEPEAMRSGELHGGAEKVWEHAVAHFGAMFYSCKLLNVYNIRFRFGLKYSEDKVFSMQCMYLADTIRLENRLMYLYRIIRDSAMSRRKFGIPYYNSIISSYLELDRQMERWANDKRGVLLEGRRCANIYVMEMIREHYQHWGSKRAMDSYLSEHAEFVSVVSGTGEYRMIRPNQEYQQYLQKTRIYIVRMYIKGAIFHLARFVRKIISKLLD